MALSPAKMFTVILNENSSLWASKRLRHTLSYRDRVKWSLRPLIRIGGSWFLPGELSIELPKSWANHYKEYWYMGSMTAKSTIVKNKICALKATSLYFSLVSSISFSAIADSRRRTLMSSDVTFELSRMTMSSSLSRIAAISLFFVRPSRIYSSMRSKSRAP